MGHLQSPVKYLYAHLWNPQDQHVNPFLCLYLWVMYTNIYYFIHHISCSYVLGVDLSKAPDLSTSFPTISSNIGGRIFTEENPGHQGTTSTRAAECLDETAKEWRSRAAKESLREDGGVNGSTRFLVHHMLTCGFACWRSQINYSSSHIILEHLEVRDFLSPKGFKLLES